MRTYMAPAANVCPLHMQLLLTLLTWLLESLVLPPRVVWLTERIIILEFLFCKWIVLTLKVWSGYFMLWIFDLLTPVIRVFLILLFVSFAMIRGMVWLLLNKEMHKTHVALLMV